jgi:hypothetical protein
VGRWVCAGLDLTAGLTAADPARAGDGRVVRRLDTWLELGGELVVAGLQEGPQPARFGESASVVCAAPFAGVWRSCDRAVGRQRQVCAVSSNK